jgi:hypothetical protein
MKSIKYLLVLAAIGFNFSSCTKQVAGPTGPTGATGAQGPVGNFYTIVDSIPASQWAATGTQFTANLPTINFLTAPNTSEVDVYISSTYSKTNQAYALWFDLPLSNYLTAGDNFNFSYNTYNMTIWYTNTSPPANAYLYFKVVVVTNP